MSAGRRRRFDTTLRRRVAAITPWASVMAGSLLTTLPVVATMPVLPPFGLLVLLSWRFTRPERLPIWAPLPLGLFDDLLSGQPLGNAVLLWTVCFLAIDLTDQRLVFRSFWQYWLFAAGAIGFCLLAGRIIAAPIGAHVDTMLLVQITVAGLLFPLCARMSVWLDRRGIAR